MEGDKSCSWCSKDYFSVVASALKRKSYVVDGKKYFLNIREQTPSEYCSAFCANQAMNYDEGKEIN